MDFKELHAEMGRNGLSIPKLAKLTNIGKKRLYSRFSGETEFTQSEITKIAEVLHLNEDKMLRIFFAN